MPDDDAHEALARIRKLTEQLDAAQKSAELTAKEVARAKSTAERVQKDARVLDTAKKRKRASVRRKR